MGRNFRKNNYNDGGRRNYADHDDRGFDRGNQVRIKDRLGHKQVGFVDGPRGGAIQKRNRQAPASKVLSHLGLLPDEDFDLDVEVKSEQAGRGRPIHGMPRRGSYRGRGSYSYTRSNNVTSNGKNLFSWSKITLRNGANYDKMWLLKELVGRSSVKFIPICYQEVNHNAIFYVEEQEAGKALRDLDKKIELPDGYDLVIIVERTTPPNISVNDDLIAKVKVGMSDRYNSANSAINLNAFHKNFAGESFFAPLWRTNILVKVVEILTQNIPEVRAIDLSNNKLMTIDSLMPLKNLSNLNILHLSDNKISDLRGLEKLKGLKLVELKLDNNPIRERLGSSYTDSLRKIFPSLQVLDGKTLPKEIGFEDDGSVTTDMPLSLPKLIKSEGAGGLVLQFLEQYFKLYDSDSRQPLLDAYDENAMMSLSSSGNYEMLKPYIEESRNLVRVGNEQRKVKLLRRGRLQIVSFLSTLPKSQHDPTTFTLDLPFTSDRLMIFTVTGMFKEREGKKAGIRHFNRCFIVVPRGNGFCIINETLYVCNPTATKAKQAFTSPESSMATLNQPPPPAAAVEVDPATKRTLATAFSEMSGMNVEWSGRCLEENQWNYDKATTVFNGIKAAGKVPPEAYIK